MPNRSAIFIVIRGLLEVRPAYSHVSAQYTNRLNGFDSSHPNGNGGLFKVRAAPQKRGCQDKLEMNNEMSFISKCHINGMLVARGSRVFAGRTLNQPPIPLRMTQIVY